MVFAVYMPPHAPSPGAMAHSMRLRSASLILPARHAPTASNESMIVTSFSGASLRCTQPGAVAELPPAGCDRAGVEEDARQVQPRRGHQHPGDRLVAPGQQDGAVQP